MIQKMIITTENNLTAIILQARLDSKRLPGKSLLDIGGKPLVFRVMEALNNIPCNLRILACPEDSAASLAPLCEEAGFKMHCGPKKDVLERFCQAIRRFGVKRVIRATADNPFVFTDAAAAVNEEAVSLNADYAGYLDLPYGAGVESVSAAALMSAASAGATAYDREHVCPFLYNNPVLYKLHRPIAPKKWRAPELRLTVDTPEDYDFAVKLYNTLKNERNMYNGEVIITHTKALRRKV